MYNAESHALQLHGCNTPVRLELSQDKLLANVLVRAFHNEPAFTYVLPDERQRLDLLPALLLAAIRVTQLYGQIDTTRMVEGAALWIAPGRESTFWQGVQEATLNMRFELGFKSFKRCLRLAINVEEVHHRLIHEPHWYLIALGVDPSRQQPSGSGALLELGLSRADSDNLPCYVETFQEDSLPLYEEHGFRIAGAGRMPDGPNFWALIRPPRVIVDGARCDRTAPRGAAT